MNTSTVHLRNPIEMAERPGLLARLLESHALTDQDEAWAGLVEAHTDLLLRTARYFGGDQDAVMDRYAFILEQLRRDQFRRLRGYTPRGDSTVTATPPSACVTQPPAHGKHGTRSVAGVATGP